MNIKTKYNIGDEVFLMRHDKIQQTKINKIDIVAYKKEEAKIRYGTYIDEDYCYKQSELFATKEELLLAL